MKKLGYLRSPGREAPAAEVAIVAPAAVTRRDLTALIKKGCLIQRAPYLPGEHAMRKLIVTAATAAFLASGGAAFAAVKHTTGTVKSFDGTAMSLVLDDGSTFTLSKAFKDPGIQAGEKVRVSWDMSGNKKIAEAAKIMK
ncbi:DUF1344 domain-containing protein [Mesorhizobium sp.]|uniref:DUF1344 domain-containing protein n=2 Tax=Mesorhizobium sp. TaxID=1871066 RepID=UPI0025C3F3F5|nr:DUF1344 domain-containing protein [Mesorhizobium sp.]